MNSNRADNMKYQDCDQETKDKFDKFFEGLIEKSTCICDCERNYSKECKNPEAYKTTGCN